MILVKSLRWIWYQYLKIRKKKEEIKLIIFDYRREQEEEALYRHEQEIRRQQELDSQFRRNIDIELNAGSGRPGSQPANTVPIKIQRVDKTELWPRKVRSDITANYR